MDRYVIVGAGAAGLTLAYYLCKAGLPVTLVEKEQEVGGLARTFHYGDYHFDIGPHRFYTANPLVQNFLNEVQSRELLEITRFSSVYFMGHYHDWPLRLSTIPKLPPLVAFKAGIDLIFKSFYTKKEIVTFKDYVLNRYGKTLYETFFKDYTEKFVGISTEQTHRNWVKVGVERATIDEKVNTASLLEIFKLMLIPKPSELNFSYPEFGGIHTFWQICARKIKDMGGEILTGTQVDSLSFKDGHVNSVSVAGREIPCTELIWSAPLPLLASMLGLPDPGLSYRSHVVYNIMLKKEPNRIFQWCYYGAKELVFSRLCNPQTFSTHTVPAGRGALCAEIAVQEGSPLWNDPLSVKDRVVEDLLKVKIISSAADIEDIKVEKVANAYPIYTVDYVERLDKMQLEFAPFDNITLLGRTGRFWYNNMDHSIENSIDVTRQLIRRAPSQSKTIQDVLASLEPPAPAQ